MPAYETDSEQVEIVRKWWGEYGKWLVAAVVIALAVSLSWRFWQNQQVKTSQQASLLYQQLVMADNQNNADTVMQMAAEMTKRYPKTEYAAMANLIAGKAAVTQNKNDLAAQKLQWVVDHAANVSIKQIARLRQARALLAQNQPAAAQKVIATVNDPVFQPAIDEVQGDIYMAEGDKAKAHQSYLAAQTGYSSVIGEDRLLTLKLAQP
jgi:predicted negative regulator of RcsB-dependent stress response